MAKQIGAQAAVLIDGNDGTIFLNEASISLPADAVDFTTFRPTGFARRFLAGLTSGAISFGGFSDWAIDALNGRAASMLGEPRDKHDVMIGPVGLDVGAPAIFAKSIRNSWDSSNMPDGMVSFSADMQITADSPATNLGLCVVTPHGTDGITAVAALADPTLAPDAVTSSTSGSLPAGTYRIAYSYSDDYGETLISPSYAIAVAGGGTGQITTTATARPAGANVVNFYLSDPGGNDSTLKLKASQASNTLVINTVATGAAPPIANTSGYVGIEEEIYNVISAAFNGISMDNGVDTTEGAEAQINVIEAVGAGRTVTVRLRDSADDATWATIGTFPALTDKGSARISIEGTVRRYVRAEIASGAITGQFIMGVAVARN